MQKSCDRHLLFKSYRTKPWLQLLSEESTSLPGCLSCPEDIENSDPFKVTERRIHHPSQMVKISHKFRL